MLRDMTKTAAKDSVYFKHSEKIHTGLPIRCPVTVYKTEDLNLTFSWIYAYL